MNALEYFAGEQLPADVFLDKYAARTLDGVRTEDHPGQMHRRIARELARVEARKFSDPLSEDRIFGLLDGFGPIIPQGSPMAGIGAPQLSTLSNCYVIGSPLDSYGGIHLADQQLTQVSKRRGGVGVDLSELRPAGAPTTNAARSSSGVVSYAERFSNSIREVGQHGRRGALMLTLSVHHPDVLAFAGCKRDRTKVTGANISVRLTDEFMRAVEAGAEYEQRWPVRGEARVRKLVDARSVWARLIELAWESAEPGLLFWDNILRESPADCYADVGFETISTNPCGELPLCALDSCRLLLLNLFSFVRDPFLPSARFDWDALRLHAGLAQRLMDDMVDLELESIDRILAKVESDPEPAEVKAAELDLWRTARDKCERGRRTGTGVTALGDAMAAVGVRYGSDESLAFADRAYRTLKLGCYRASVDMARELGPFPAWDPAREEGCPFLLRIRDEDPALYADMRRYGRRNIALLTTAPAGSTSLVAGPPPYFGTTSGIEPLFADEPHVRRKKVTDGMDARVDFVDATGDRWTNFEVFHPKIRMWMDVTGERDWRKSPYHGCCAQDLDWRQRVRLQAAATRHIDHSLSSTINIPNSATVADVAMIYEEAWRSGCKGMTVYRDGCRDGVLLKKPERRAGDAPKRPTQLPCDVHHVTVRGAPMTVVVGLMDGVPYEIFPVPGRVGGAARQGLVVKRKRGVYDLLSADGGERLLDEPSLSGMLSDTEEALARMVSVAMRHGVDLGYVVQQLEKSRGDMLSFGKSMARALKKYIKEGSRVTGERCGGCGEESLCRQEGCVTCKACGWSRC